jgi:hypothetical protein
VVPRHETYPLSVDGEEVFVRLEAEGARMAVGSMTPGDVERRARGVRGR